MNEARRISRASYLYLWRQVFAMNAKLANVRLSIQALPLFSVPSHLFNINGSGMIFFALPLRYGAQCVFVKCNVSLMLQATNRLGLKIRIILDIP